jgi:uncharacterized RDD family membrane protein YckC
LRRLPTADVSRLAAPDRRFGVVRSFRDGSERLQLGYACVTRTSFDLSGVVSCAARRGKTGPMSHEVRAPRSPPAPSSVTLDFASWWQRALAWWIDIAFFALVIAVLWVIWPPDFDAPVSPLTRATQVDALRPSTIVLQALLTLYFTAGHGSASGQTLGKRVLRIRVADAWTGGTIGHGRALGRYIVTILMTSVPVLSIVLAYLDRLWPLWDRRHQALHDKPVRSVVLRCGR